MPAKILRGGVPALSIIGGIKRTIAVIDRFTDASGQTVAWLTLAIMVVTCTLVTMRYLVGSNGIALQELVVYLHATVFMWGAAFTLKRGGHVRIDILYRTLSRRSRALIDVLGGLLFLVPVCVLIFWLSWDYVINSWAVRETSSESSGLPWVYVLKTLMLVMPSTLLIQGTAEILRNLLVLLADAEQGTTP